MNDDGAHSLVSKAKKNLSRDAYLVVNHCAKIHSTLRNPTLNNQAYLLYFLQTIFCKGLYIDPKIIFFFSLWIWNTLLSNKHSSFRISFVLLKEQCHKIFGPDFSRYTAPPGSNRDAKKRFQFFPNIHSFFPQLFPCFTAVNNIYDKCIAGVIDIREKFLLVSQHCQVRLLLFKNVFPVLKPYCSEITHQCPRHRRVPLCSISDTEMRPYHISYSSDIKPTRYRTYQISNLCDNELVW
jgi:hypothetical protein